MLEQLNMTLFHLINQYAGLNPFADAAAVLAAKYMPIVIILGLVYLWIRRKETRNVVLYGTYAAVLGLILNFIIGLVYYHPRPFMVPVGTLLFPYSPDSSFPSDHTTFMLSAAFMLMYFKKTRKTGLILVVSGLIGGFARVFCGVHFPMDIFGSVLVALAISILVYQFRNSLKPLNSTLKGVYIKVTEMFANN